MPFFRHRIPPPPTQRAASASDIPSPTHRPTLPHSQLTSPANRTSTLVDTSDDEHYYRILSTKRQIQTSPRSELPRTKFSAVDLPSPELEFSNRLLVCPSDFASGIHVLVNETFPLTVRHEETGKLAPGQVGISAIQQQWMSVSVSSGDTVTVWPLDLPRQGLCLASLDLEIDFLQRGLDVSETFSADEMTKRFIQSFKGQLFAQDQQLGFDFHGQTLKAIVKSLSIIELGENRQQTASIGVPSGMGVLMENTEVAFVKAADSRIKLKAIKPASAILMPNLKIEELGIGGLHTEFSTIIRRAFASRLVPLQLVDDLGIQHVKGIILFGPPGTGKTLMARQIGKILNAREPKIVNGPEILNRFVGESEGNIRKLFVEAEQEYKEKGEQSGLHIIIFDEIDSICKRRGADSGGGNRVGDGVVNQLLSKMDGVEQMNNVLFIGMTNRFDMLDDALLRPGRFEVHIGLPLPNKEGRQQILTIHTSTMKQSGSLSPDVDLAEIADQTNNFSGAEIHGLVKNAMSFAFNRHVKPGTVAGTDVENLQVDMNDFIESLQEVRPAHGATLQQLELAVPHGIIHFDESIRTILYNSGLYAQQASVALRRVGAKHRFLSQSQDSHFAVVPTPIVPILLHGPPGSGKTALAATIAIQSRFSFIKIISSDNMVGFGEAQLVDAIRQVFEDSHKSPLSVIILDNIERLLGWVPIGPKYSNRVLQALLVLLQRRPPKGHGLLVIATTAARTVLADLQLLELFDAEFSVPPISSMESLGYVLREIRLFPDEELQHAMEMIERGVFSGDRVVFGGTQDKYSGSESPHIGFGLERPQIGVKKLLRIVAWARQDPNNVAERLVEALMADMVSSKGTTTYTQTLLLE